ncbi:MAG: hypothetical protein ACRCZY_07300 [Phocaeicola sp.]
MNSLTADQLSKMQTANIFLFGQDDGIAISDGHKILSAKAKELFDLGLVEFSDLDIIDPDYNPEKNSEYWVTRLGNTRFTIDHFFAWLKENTETFIVTINNEELNLSFWRWMKENYSEKQMADLPELPILLSNGSIENVTSTIYFSDGYMSHGAGIENSVKAYDANALFLSAKYIDEEGDKEEWIKFWSAIGIKYEIVDILVKTVIPNLANIEDEQLPRLLAENRSALEEYYEDGIEGQLTALRVKGSDGNFYTINKTIYIDCEKEEPFCYIKLPNQISFATKEERRLIKDIIEEVDGDYVETLSDWQQRKLDCYLAMQRVNIESVREFHYRFINDLSFIRNKPSDSLRELERIDEIYILNKKNEFCRASELTVSSVYNPFFDFEACNIDSLDYISNSYKEKCSEYPGRLFRTLRVHHDIEKKDLQFLENRKCAIYFWSTYLIKKEANINRIKQFIEDNLLDEINCIPTKDYIKSPKDLYSTTISSYVKATEDAENKLPLTELPNIKLPNGGTLFELLPFKESLGFLDALYALCTIAGQDRRTTLLEWMIDSYDSKYDDKIAEYREDDSASWVNSNNEKVQIKELYALDYGDNILEQYFSSNSRIINKLYLPTGESYRKACDILGIKIITTQDLIIEPVGAILYTSKDKDLRFFALVFAGIEDVDNWSDSYSKYCEKLDILSLYRCQEITIKYARDESISQSLKTFYHNRKSNVFFFRYSLTDGRVYLDFVKEFSDYLGMCNVDYDLLKANMYSVEDALTYVKKQNALMLDDIFKDELDKIIPGIKRELSGNELVESDEEETPQRPTFTAQMDDADTDMMDILTDDTIDTEGVDDNSTSTEDILDEENYIPHKNSTRNTAPKSRNNEENRIVASTPKPTQEKSTHPYMENETWASPRRNYISREPKPFSPEDVRNFGSKGVTRTLEMLEPTKAEIDTINNILGEDLSAEEVADQNYLSQLRFHNNLIEKGLKPDESLEDFIRNGHLKNEHTISGGKYVHKCSAVGGIMYISPSIWNKIADDCCVVCVYFGAKQNDFMYINNLDELIQWIKEDDIVIKLTGKEKVDVVKTLYGGVLKGVKGSAYTLIRINSNEKYNSLFAP